MGLYVFVCVCVCVCGVPATDCLFVCVHVSMCVTVCGQIVLNLFELWNNLVVVLNYSKRLHRSLILHIVYTIHNNAADLRAQLFHTATWSTIRDIFKAEK